MMTLKEKLQHRKYLNQKRKELYNNHCKKDNPYREDNAGLIDYVIYTVLSEQMLNKNGGELEALQILSNRGIDVKYQEPIPIVSQGGKLEHLYIADILYNNVIIEIDGSSHGINRQIRDFYRDEDTKKAGYTTKRFRTSEVYKLKNEIL